VKNFEVEKAKREIAEAERDRVRRNVGVTLKILFWGLLKKD
jgi:hypothetical protein